MAEGGFDDIEMEDRNGYKMYPDYRLQNEYEELEKKRDILDIDSQGEDMQATVRVKRDGIVERLLLIGIEQDRRKEGAEEQETSFSRPSAPGKHDVATLKRMQNMDKKTYLRDILKVKIRVGHGPHSKELLDRFNVNTEDGSAEFDGVRIFVKRGRGTDLTKDKKMHRKVMEFNELFEKAKDERGLPTVDLTNAPRDSVHGLTEQENRELRGVLTPTSSIIRSTRVDSLRIKLDAFQGSLDNTNDTLNGEGVNPTQELELRDRAVGLEEAIDRTLEQINLEEVRELQEEDIGRLERFKEWVKENWLGASALAASVASLIAAVIVGARTAAVKGMKATKSFAKAVRDAIKKLGLWAVPIANFLYTLLKGGAAVLGWLASNLWVLVLALTWFAYDYYKEARSRPTTSERERKRGSGGVR